LQCVVTNTANDKATGTASVGVAAPGPSTVLLDLGHANGIQALRMSGDRALSLDYSGHWALWAYTAGTELASGDGASAVELAGTTVAIGTAAGVEFHDASDGHALATVGSGAAWWALASDGSYATAATTLGISAWAPDGTLLVSEAGDYSKAKVFAAPGELRIALGAAGANLIETLSTGGGTSVLSPAFSGTFQSWFTDGASFLSTLSTTVWTYTKDASQVALVTLPTVEGLTGQGNWLWTFSSNSSLVIYPVGSNVASASYSVVYGAAVPSGQTIGLIPYGTASTSRVDLSGASPSKTDYTLPVAYTTAYATSASGWLVGNKNGVIVDGPSLATTPRYLDLGTAWDIAGGAGRVAVAEASGAIQYFDPATGTLQGSLPFSSSKLAMSDDGSVLAAAANANDAQYEPDRTLNAYTLPSQSLINTWPSTFNSGSSTPYLSGFSLSGSGTVVGLVTQAGSGATRAYTREAVPTAGGASLWSDTQSGELIRLSPDGTYIAVSSGPPDSIYDAPLVTDIYHNGVLVTAVPGWAAGWIDNGQLLVNSYAVEDASFVQYTSCAIYGTGGALLAAPPLPELRAFQPLGLNEVYAPALNAIFDTVSGASIWTSVHPSKGVGAVSGTNVIFASGSQVLVEPH
ncbi:MAG TPA: hypothetical protein VL181_02770, partial [Holophagaceae bacterium]|nr:hypothetical protein [Holophagaceae bacterium]